MVFCGLHGNGRYVRVHGPATLGRLRAGSHPFLQIRFRLRLHRRLPSMCLCIFAVLICTYIDKTLLQDTLLRQKRGLGRLVQLWILLEEVLVVVVQLSYLLVDASQLLLGKVYGSWHLAGS